ncbi:MAG: TonB-dependent receptor, partial [Mariniphaga sp.]
NEVLNLYGQPYILGGSAEFRQISMVGEPLQSFYGYEVAGVYQNEEEINADPIAVENNLVPGDFIYVDQNNDDQIDDDDRVILGSYFPDFTYGANLEINWRNVDFSMNIMGQTGNSILNRRRGEIIWTADGNMDADLAVNRWHGPGTSDIYPSSSGLRRGWNQKMSDYLVEDGTFFRLQNVTVGYTIDGDELFGTGFPEARVSFTAEKPLTIFDYNGFTPEVPDGWDRQTYPVPAVYTVGLNVKF